MSAPWKELLLFYQQKEDARIKYEQVIEQFEPTGILDERLQTGGPNDVPMFRPEDELVVSSVGYSEDSGRLPVENASFSFKLGSQLGRAACRERVCQSV